MPPSSSPPDDATLNGSQYILSGIRFTEYQDMWNKLNPYEKCLFYWAEVNQFGLDLEQQLTIPWLRLKYEDLFHGNGLEHLLDFLNLPKRESLFEQKGQLVDQFRYLSPVWQDWKLIENHPRVMEIARQLGYGLEEIEETILRQRYLMGQTW